MSIPRFSSLWAGSGDVAFGEVWSLTAVVADDLVDFYDDVLGVLDGTDGCRSVCLQTSEGWRFSGSYKSLVWPPPSSMWSIVRRHGCCQAWCTGRRTIRFGWGLFWVSCQQLLILWTYLKIWRSNGQNVVYTQHALILDVVPLEVISGSYSQATRITNHN